MLTLRQETEHPLTVTSGMKMTLTHPRLAALPMPPALPIDRWTILPAPGFLAVSD